MPSPASSLRHRLQQPETLICPGVFNALVARMAKQANFESVYISGGATANVAGVPDTGLLSLTEFTRTIREIVDASGLPVVADADTGYGEEETRFGRSSSTDVQERQHFMLKIKCSPNAAGILMASNVFQLMISRKKSKQ